MRWTNWMLLAAAGLSSASAFGRDISVRDREPLPVVILLADDHASSPVVELGGSVTVHNAPHAKQKGAYLGVSTSSAPTVIRKQLALPEGMGLVVDIVMPESPAAAAGLKEFDVLQKLDDQLLINAEQLAVLVRSHKSGDEIKLTFFREGKSMTVTAKLSEHEIEPIPGNLSGWIDADPHRFEFRNNDVKVQADFVTLVDGDNLYTISTDDREHRKFIVKTNKGAVLFEGRIDTPKDREQVPEAMREKLKQLEQITGHAPESAKEEK